MQSRVRALRGEHGWSQAELAIRLGVSRQTVNAIETGRYDPSLSLAFRIARLFARPIEEVFTPDEWPQVAAAAPPGPPTRAVSSAGEAGPAPVAPPSSPLDVGAR